MSPYPITARLVHRSLQATVLGVLVVGVGLGNVSVVVNAGLALAVMGLPAVLARDFGVQLAPRLTAWIGGAVTIHALGMVVLYEQVWWWDHLTHLVSATLVAGIGYAVTRSLDEHSDAVSFPRPFLAVYVLLFTLAAGVAWELAEMVGREAARTLGMEPILVVYGLEDTMLDLVFDFAGGVVVAVGGSDALAGLVTGLRDEGRREGG